jgi:hypothetical protein
MDWAKVVVMKEAFGDMPSRRDMKKAEENGAAMVLEKEVDDILAEGRPLDTLHRPVQVLLFV